MTPPKPHLTTLLFALVLGAVMLFLYHHTIGKK